MYIDTQSYTYSRCCMQIYRLVNSASYRIFCWGVESFGGGIVSRCVLIRLVCKPHPSSEVRPSTPICIKWSQCRSSTYTVGCGCEELGCSSSVPVLFCSLLCEVLPTCGSGPVSSATAPADTSKSHAVICVRKVSASAYTTYFSTVYWEEEE